MGQLRSAVVPYAISVLHLFTSGAKGDQAFDLMKIWQREGLEQELKEMLTTLIELMNDVIKKYAESDDYGEYSKRKELWDNIVQSVEIKKFTESPDFGKIVKKYTVTKDEIRKRLAKKNKIKTVDFSNLSANARIFSRRADYYKKLGLLLSDQLTVGQRNKMDHLIYCINNKTDISPAYCEFEEEITQKVRTENPEIFDHIEIDEDPQWIKAYDFITTLYNQCLENGSDILSEFQRQRELARLKGAKFYAVYDEIGKNLASGKSPVIKQLQSVGNIQFNNGFATDSGGQHPRNIKK